MKGGIGSCLGLPRRAWIAVVTLCVVVYFLWSRQMNQQAGEINAKLNDVPPPGEVEKGIVTAKMRKEDVQWIHDLRPDWTPYIYSASQPPEPGYKLVPPGYRGREAITYLSFIIDFYDSLPKYTAFVHAGHSQWHNDLLGPYTSTVLQNVRLDMVDRKGYVNLRCAFDPGCPLGVNPFEPTDIDIKGKDIRAYFADVYMELFDVPSSKVPEHVGNVCCGQFVVSRERILERPKKDYERMRRWALESSVTNSFGVGWVFEKVWHIIFGMEAIYCPDPVICRCELLGWCGPVPDKCDVTGTKAVKDTPRDEGQQKKIGTTGTGGRRKGKDRLGGIFGRDEI